MGRQEKRQEHMLNGANGDAAEDTSMRMNAAVASELACGYLENDLILYVTENIPRCIARYHLLHVNTCSDWSVLLAADAAPSCRHPLAKRLRTLVRLIGTGCPTIETPCAGA
jgi:hypothetical protein